MRREQHHTPITVIGDKSFALRLGGIRLRPGMAGGRRDGMGLRHFLRGREGPPPSAIPGLTIAQVTKMIAEQAHGEVMRLRPGQRLIIERTDNERASFTITVESMERFPRGD